jgi:hypothetical protein
VPWEPIAKPWNDVSVDYCEVCGNLLIRRYWRFTTPSGVELRACSEDCEQLYARLNDSTATGVAAG